MTPDHYHTSASMVTEICEPFLNQFGLNLFVYGRFLSDDNFYGVLTDPTFGEHLLKKQVVPYIPPLPKRLKQLSFFCFWHNTLPDWVIPEMNKSQYYYPLSYFNVTSSYFEHFTFASSINSISVINTYLNQIDSFKKFCAYFKNRAYSLLEAAKKAKIYYPKQLRIPLESICFENIENQRLIEKDIYPTDKVLASDIIDVTLSNQEMRCLQYISHGRTAKECALMMNLSPKTVQNYIYNMKNKLGVYRKSQLIDIYQQMEYGEKEIKE